MKKLVVILVVILSFSTLNCLAAPPVDRPEQKHGKSESSTAVTAEEAGVRGEYLAEQKVRMLPSKQGATVDSYMTNMAKIPLAEDLGWKVSTVEDGYEVERSIQYNKAKTFSYRWKVSNSGEVTPMNDRARALMK